jgi:hypothetical protein
MNNALKTRYPPFRDEQSLRAAIETICAKFGKVKSLTIVPGTRTSQDPAPHCACFLRLDSAESESALRAELKVFTFGGDIAFFADMDENWSDQHR